MRNSWTLNLGRALNAAPFSESSSSSFLILFSLLLSHIFCDSTFLPGTDRPCLRVFLLGSSCHFRRNFLLFQESISGILRVLRDTEK